MMSDIAAAEICAPSAAAVERERLQCSWPFAREILDDQYSGHGCEGVLGCARLFLLDLLAAGGDLSSNTNSAAASKDSGSSPWSPFRHPSFTVLWTATVVANIGTWMYNAASGWLMTNLNPDPFIVSMVQVATTLPMFLFALPAGALADIIDRRKFLVVAEIAITVVSAVFAAIVSLGLATPGNLLLFTFLIGVGSALTAPAWQSIVPQLVPKQDLHPAVAANSVGMNISRAIGPALGGVVTAAWGIAAPFWLNAATNLGVIGALLWWRTPKSGTRHLP